MTGADGNSPPADSMTLRPPHMWGPIDSLCLRGFKSHKDTRPLALKRLTILAGENSGGKSSLLQPLLMMKQTLEASYDPGVLELQGSCVDMDRAANLFWRGPGAQENSQAHSFEVSLGLKDISIAVEYLWKPETRGGLELGHTRVTWAGGTSATLTTGGVLTTEELAKAGIFPISPWAQREWKEVGRLEAVPGRCAHGLFPFRENLRQFLSSIALGVKDIWLPSRAIEDLIHLPGLRGSPKRSYRATRVGDRFPGPFPVYTASALEDWKDRGDARLAGVEADLQHLRLTKRVDTRRVDDANVEVRFSRTWADGQPDDLVNVADVGLGASQALPVVVALRAAAPHQMVHIEQPELHLHPNAQVAMADLLIAAARRRARVIVETHSSVLLRALQVAIAEDHDGLHELVAFHWFARDAEGATTVRTADLQPNGSLGDWPVDFADVEMDIHRRFIRASARHGRSKR